MTLANRILTKSKIFGEFTLRSGKVSDSYFDKYQFESDPELLADIAEAMVAKLPADIEVLAGLEMGGIPIVTMLSHMTGLPAAFIRKKPKEYGTCLYSEGADLEGKTILLIEDVVSSGGAIIDSARMLRADGIPVDRTICVIDRETGGFEKLAEEGIQLLSLFKQSEIDASA
ncbi:MAG: orotate phosphoribosyltransferase [Desulfobacterales bacterium]